ADDDENIIVGFILVRRCGRIDPIAACIATEQDNLEYARALPRAGCVFSRPTEFVEDDLYDALKFALLRGGKVIGVCAHDHESLGIPCFLARAIASKCWA